MKISKEIANQIAMLLNTQNQLTILYSVEKILEDQNNYIVKMDEQKETLVLGVVEVKKVQWYQCEIKHLSVLNNAKRQGIGTWLLKKAEQRAKKLGARIAQCTIRNGNLASENLFLRTGFYSTVTFVNEQNHNKVTVYQKVL